MRWWVIALLACTKASESASPVPSETVAKTAKPTPSNEPAVSADPAPSIEPVVVASAVPSAKTIKTKGMSSAEAAALAAELEALQTKPLGALAAAPTMTGSLSSSSPPASPSVTPPKGEVTVGAAKGASGVDAILAKHRWRFKACYQKQLSIDPAAAGTITTAVTFDDAGTVTSYTQTSSTAPAAVSLCIVRGFASMKFPPGNAGKFTVDVTLKPIP